MNRIPEPRPDRKSGSDHPEGLKEVSDTPLSDLNPVRSLAKPECIQR